MCYNENMNIALLGYGKEGQATENYFKSHFPDATFTTFENLTPEEFTAADYSAYDMIFRSPSIPPFNNPKLTSITKYFFDHCPCPVIGVTATKGKGTTCSFIKSLLDAEGRDAYLVGNIGEPAINVLDDLTESSVVVYEMSSFQLWDLEKSPHIAVVGHIEPDHLNVHKDFADYTNAKSHIAKYQTPNDYCIYNYKNPEASNIAELSAGHKVPYPFPIPEGILKTITLPGRHNEENAIAAIAALAAYNNLPPDEYLSTSSDTIKKGLAAFHGLPHRLEFLRELHGIKYYDDNFATTASSMKVAIEAFPGAALFIIAGGRDKTAGADLPVVHEVLQSANVREVYLIGESGHALAATYPDAHYKVYDSLADAVKRAQQDAESFYTTNPDNQPIVLMSPAAASFDMFENVYDRGNQYQTLVASLS